MDQGGEYYKRYLHGDQDAFVSLVQMYMDGLVLFLTSAESKIDFPSPSERTGSFFAFLPLPA